MDGGGEAATQSPAGRLRAAYRADDDAGRIAAMRAIWDAGAEGDAGKRDRYAGLILTTRADAALPPSAWATLLTSTAAVKLAR